MTGPEDVLLGVAGGWCAPPDTLCVCGGKLSNHVCTLTMVGPRLDLPDAVVARGHLATCQCDQCQVALDIMERESRG